MFWILGIGTPWKGVSPDFGGWKNTADLAAGGTLACGKVWLTSCGGDPDL
ncbi:MAG: hypothetical protein LBB16_00560 [Puniceicoccales bacterium]|nr:hypothetical protein [Puniceicoccales bacterium]